MLGRWGRLQDEIETIVVAAILAGGGVVLGAAIFARGQHLAGLVVGVLPLTLILGNVLLVRLIRSAPWFPRHGGWAAGAVLSAGIAMSAASIVMTAECLGGPCLAADGLPVAVILFCAGLAEIVAGFLVLHPWAVVAGKVRLAGALEGAALAVHGIALIGQLLLVAGEFGIVAAVVVLVFLFLVSLALGVSMLWTFLALIIGIVLLGAVVGFLVGPSGMKAGTPGEVSAAAAPDPRGIPPPGPPRPAPPGHPSFPAPALAPAPPASAYTLPPAYGPPPGYAPPPAHAAFPPAPPTYLHAPPVAPYGHAVPPAVCPRCHSPRLAYAPPPARGFHCYQCGLAGAY
ncbi:MAG TPA: hypothetical protein VGB42_07400 [Candidatus Thermoplasmatota archaeon]